jgi:hypothetical protein
MSEDKLHHIIRWNVEIAGRRQYPWSASFAGASCMLGWQRPHLSLPGEECSSGDGRCLSRARKTHDVVQRCVVHTPRVVCGVQACENRPMAQRRSSRCSG